MEKLKEVLKEKGAEIIEVNNSDVSWFAKMPYREVVPRNIEYIIYKIRYFIRKNIYRNQYEADILIKPIRMYVKEIYSYTTGSDKVFFTYKRVNSDGTEILPENCI